MMKKREKHSNSQSSRTFQKILPQDQSNIITFNQPKQLTFNQLIDKNKIAQNPYQTTSLTKRDTNISEIDAFKSGITSRGPSALMVSAAYGNKFGSVNSSISQDKIFVKQQQHLRKHQKSLSHSFLHGGHTSSIKALSGLNKFDKVTNHMRAPDEGSLTIYDTFNIKLMNNERPKPLRETVYPGSLIKTSESQLNIRAKKHLRMNSV